MIGTERKWSHADTNRYEPFDPDDDDQEASLLGEGTFGATHKMRSKTDGRLYAVKMMKVRQAGAELAA